MVSLLTIVLAVIIVLLLMLVINKYKEGFESKREKAAAIKNWFEKNNKPSYADYQREVPNSDVLEYTSVKKMGQSSKQYDETAIESLIS